MTTRNLIDTPLLPTQDDTLDIEPYVDALVEYLKGATLPTTLAIQGEWGCGKTSLMNRLRSRLCGDAVCGDLLGAQLGTGKPSLAGDEPYLGIWVNTWEASLLKDPKDAVAHIVQRISAQLVELTEKRSATEETLRLGQKLLGTVAKVGARAAAAQLGFDARSVDDMGKYISAARDASVSNSFKETLQEVISKSIRSGGSNKRGIVFFVDDLDRLDPPVAVQILSLLKNFFEVDNCLFILAIDYDVVVRGLEPRFGKMDGTNEREFRSFFDKIIQVPFSMPTSNYKTQSYLKSALSTIGYYEASELEDAAGAPNPVLSEVALFTKVAVQNNPRSIKRIINTLSLIRLICQARNQQLVANGVDNRLLLFALVSLQIAYPSVYRMLNRDSVIDNWGHTFRYLIEEEEDEAGAPETAGEENAGADEGALAEADYGVEDIIAAMARKTPFIANHRRDILEFLEGIRRVVTPDGADGEEGETVPEWGRIADLMRFTAASEVNASEPIDDADTQQLREEKAFYQSATSPLYRQIVRRLVDEIDQLFASSRMVKNFQGKSLTYHYPADVIRDPKAKGWSMRKTKAVQISVANYWNTVEVKVFQFGEKGGSKGEDYLSLSIKELEGGRFSVRGALFANRKVDHQIDKREFAEADLVSGIWFLEPYMKELRACRNGRKTFTTKMTPPWNRADDEEE